MLPAHKCICYLQILSIAGPDNAERSDLLPLDTADILPDSLPSVEHQVPHPKLADVHVPVLVKGQLPGQSIGGGG